MSNDQNLGLYGKYQVHRTDGSSAPGGKHEKCFVFVLDLDHDPHAITAMWAYIQSAKREYPFLAQDLAKAIYAAEKRNPELPKSPESYECPHCGGVKSATADLCPFCYPRRG